MSCFWTDLVRAAQNCGGDGGGDGPDPADAYPSLFASVSTTTTDVLWFIPGGGPSDGPCSAVGEYQGGSPYYDGPYTSARYAVSQAYFDAITCNTDPRAVLGSLTREAMHYGYDNADNGFILGDAMTALSWPANSYWIVELTPEDGYGDWWVWADDEWQPSGEETEGAVFVPMPPSYITFGVLPA